MNVREAVVQRRWSNPHDVRFPCIRHNSSFLKLFMYEFYWYREFDWQLTSTFSRIDWRNDWHMYVFLVSCKTVFHFLLFCGCFFIVLWHSEAVPVPNQSYSMWILPCPGMRSSHFCEVVVVALPLSAASMPSDPYHERMLASCASGPKRQSTGSNVRECETSTTESGKQPCAHPRAVAWVQYAVWQNKPE